MDERRRYARVRMTQPVQLEWAGGHLDGIVRDMSRGGIYVETTENQSVQLGQEVVVRMQGLVITMSVVRIEPGHGVALKMAYGG